MTTHETVTVYEPQPNDDWPYFTCPKCRHGFITREFQRCIICGSRIKWKRIDNQTVRNIMKTYYMHTINGKPAFYEEGRQIFYMVFYGKANPLAESLKQIRREQRASMRWRKQMGCVTKLDYGYFRVCIPNPSVDPTSEWHCK